MSSECLPRPSITCVAGRTKTSADSTPSSTVEGEDKVQLAHADIPSRHTGFQPESTNEDFPARGKRRHNSSSDSSLLESPIRPKSQQLVREVLRNAASNQQKNGSTPPRKKQRIAYSDSDISSPSSISSNAVHGSFEKEARRKTREDRYEPKKKDTKSKNTRGKKSSKKKREKKSDRKISGRKSGADLAHNFSSKSIGQDRLTVSIIRISVGPGLIIGRYAHLMALDCSKMAAHLLPLDVVAVG
jgi:hypothetical protein